MLLADNLERVTWHCLHFAEAGEETVALAKLLDHGLARFQIDGALIHTEQDTFSALARTMNFPEYFGGNWDAVDECLRDMEWLPAPGYVLLVRYAKSLWQAAPHLGGALVESWLFAAEEWSKAGKPFHLVFIW